MIRSKYNNNEDHHDGGRLPSSTFFPFLRVNIIMIHGIFSNFLFCSLSFFWGREDHHPCRYAQEATRRMCESISFMEPITLSVTLA
jgi:hypothetical protein